MKKSAPKKLILNRKTLQTMEKQEAEAAIGGATTLCTVGCTCNSRNTCSSKYC